MNWHRRFAIVLLVIGIASVAAIWFFDPNDAHYKQIDLTLKVAAAIGTISGIYLAIFGAARDHRREGRASQTYTAPAAVSAAPQSQPDIEAEIQVYLANLEKILSETSIPEDRFIELSAEAAAKRDSSEFELLQDFEWARKEGRAELERIAREPVSLLGAQESFERFVLLGDPGAGKTTCLQFIARRDAVALGERILPGINKEILPCGGWPALLRNRRPAPLPAPHRPSRRCRR